MIQLEGWALGGATGGLTFAGMFLFVRWVANFIAGRWDKKEAQLDGATARLIEGLERRLNEETKSRHRIETELRLELGQVRDQLAECIRKHQESDARVMQLEAAQLGLGQGRQTAQLIVAAEKAEQRDAKKAERKE